jgi:hypothetical protein
MSLEVYVLRIKIVTHFIADFHGLCSGVVEAIEVGYSVPKVRGDRCAQRSAVTTVRITRGCLEGRTVKKKA